MSAEKLAKTSKTAKSKVDNTEVTTTVSREAFLASFSALHKLTPSPVIDSKHFSC